MQQGRIKSARTSRSKTSEARAQRRIGTDASNPDRLRQGEPEAAKERRSNGATPKTPKGKQRKLAFVAATARALNRRGYRELTVSDIAAEAGAPVGLFYRYFRSKGEAVLEALNVFNENFHSTLQTGELSFFEHLAVGHRNLIAAYEQSHGLLGCCFSFEYGEKAFATFFHEATVGFDREHARRALKALGTPAGIKVDDLLLLSHALTSMVDNFVFRYCTGRDETASLEKSAQVDVAALLAQLRARAFLLHESPTSRAALTSPPASPKPRSSITLPEPAGIGPADPLTKRQPKRADSTASFGAMKDATLRLLNRLSYDEMRIQDIEEATQITRGSIYHYFGEKRDLVLALLRERLSALHSKLQSCAAEPATEPFEDLRRPLRELVAEFAANPGILRVAYQLEQSDAEAADLISEYRRLWARYLGDLAAMRGAAPASHRNAYIMVGYAMLAMVERFSYDLHVLPNPEIHARMRGVDEAEFVAAVWTRALFLQNPPAATLKRHPILARLRARDESARA